MQFQFVVLGHKRDRDLARAAQRRRIIDQQRPADIDDGCTINEILSISQSEHDRLALACFRNRNCLDPSRNWIGQREGPCRDLDLSQLGIVLRVLRVGFAEHEANTQHDRQHRSLERVQPGGHVLVPCVFLN